MLAYARSSCNNDWCGYIYDYYFEKDVGIEHFADPVGHRNDWEHVGVFVYKGVIKIVAASQHGGWDVRAAQDVRFQGDHPKIV